MPGVFLVSIDGVLATPGRDDSFAASSIVSEGRLIYQSFVAMGATIILFSRQPEKESDKVKYWLRAHGFVSHGNVVYDPWPQDLNRSVEHLVTRVRSSGPLDLAVEADPARAARLLHQGVPTLLFAKPAYTRSEFRPDLPTEVRPWDQVVAELDEQWSTDSEDPRVASEVAGVRFEE